MPSNKKYDFIVEPSGSKWVAKVTRKASSKKTVISKQKDGFKSQEEAQSWAESTLEELTKTLKESNERHGKQRKNLEEIRRNRSSRRAEKTELAKAKKAEEAEENEKDEEES